MKPSIEKRLRFWRVPPDRRRVSGSAAGALWRRACLKEPRAAGQFSPPYKLLRRRAGRTGNSHLKPEDRTTPEDGGRARRAAAKYANVADRPPFFTLDGDTGTAVDAISNAEVEGYHGRCVGFVANAHIASCESAHAQKRLVWRAVAR